MWIQKTISLMPKRRGFHLVTREVLEQVPELAAINVGLMTVFIQPKKPAALAAIICIKGPPW